MLQISKKICYIRESTIVRYVYAREKMINREMIEEVKNRLIKVYDPLQIYLFGSYAWGNPNQDSDLDILIIIKQSDEQRHKRSIKASDALWDLKVPKDLLVLTEQEFMKRENDVTTLCYKVKHEGELLYARA